MKRANVGSVLFLGGTLFFLLAPAGESAAQEHETTRTDSASSAAGIKAQETSSEMASAGLKGVRLPNHEEAVETALSRPCGENQVEIDGDYCPSLEQNCIRWMDPETTMPRRCAEFAPTGKCQSKTVRKHFCIDKFEYPNERDRKPVVMKTWFEAADACKAQGKRLCGDSEWTLACEGQERLPYPYGYERNAQACNIDKPHPDVNETALANPATREAEVARLWQGEPSGTRESCVSPFGAMDMTGNVDEWVINESGLPYKSGLKGGYWGPVRDRCRPITTAHYENFAFYQIGFRCCSEAGAVVSAKAQKPQNEGAGSAGS